MSRWPTKTELLDDIRDTINKSYGGTPRYNMAGVHRDLDIIGDSHYGWTFQDPGQEAFERALEQNRRNPSQPWRTIRTAEVDNHDRPLLPALAAATGQCPQCNEALAYAELVPHTNRLGDATDGTLTFDSHAVAWHDAASNPHLFCVRCVCEYSLDGVTIEFR